MEPDDIDLAGIRGSINLDNAEQDEVSLLSEAVRPATTEELVDMLKHAGTELTVKYLTGELTFQGFCKEMEKSKHSDTPKPLPGTQRQTTASHAPMKILAFDQLLEEGSQDEAGDEEEYEDEEDVEDSSIERQR